MAKQNKLDRVAKQFKAKLLEESREKSLVTLAEAGKYIAEKQGHIEELKTWENAINEQREKLEKKIVVGKDRHLVQLQRSSVEGLASTLLFLLNDGYEFNYQNFSQVEHLFWNIEWLVGWCSHAEGAETHKRTSKSFFNLIEASNLRQKDKLEGLNRQIYELEKIKTAFRGVKIARKNQIPYKRIIQICENDFIGRGVGEQWSNAVGIYATEEHLSLTQKETLYKSFIKFRSGKTIEEMKNLLLESRV